MFGDALQKGVKKKKMFPFYVLRSLPASPHICSMKIFDNIVQYLLLRIAVLERRRAKLSDFETWAASWTAPCREWSQSRRGSRAGRAGRRRAWSRWRSRGGRSRSKPPPPDSRWNGWEPWPGRIPLYTGRCSRPSPSRGQTGRCTANKKKKNKSR